MAAQSSIVLADAAGTPVNHTFAPMGVIPPAPGRPNDGVPRWLWRCSDYGKYVDGVIASAIPPVGWPTFVLGIRQPNGGNRNYKVNYLFTLPALEPISGVSATGYSPPDRAASQAVFRVEAVIPERLAPAVRQDFHKMAVKPLDFALGAGSPLYDALRDLIPVW